MNLSSQSPSLSLFFILALSLFFSACICEEGFNPPDANPPLIGCKTLNPDGKTCKECMSGRGPNADATQCESCPNECLKCPFKDGKNVCTECASSHFLSAEKKCEECPTRCEKCTSKDKCDQCYDNSLMTAEGKCIGCDKECTTCDRSGSCTKCAEGFFAAEKVAGTTDNVKCSACIERCAVCENSSKCLKCIGFDVSKDGTCPEDPNRGKHILYMVLGIIGAICFVSLTVGCAIYCCIREHRRIEQIRREDPDAEIVFYH